mmetsp:Transcript_66810/g.159883  ORF Transcript_66810/g.159883 Transcript_66810/m.159883 type:complete len:911 (-) Transcript_66810:104-2836(-)
MATAIASQLWGPNWTPLDRSATGVEAVFDAFDLNHDGIITRKEVSDVLGGPATGRRRAVPGPSADLNLGFDPQLQAVADVEALLEGTQLDASRPGQRPANLPDLRASAFHSIAYGPALAGGFCGDRLQFTISTVSSSGRKCYDAEARVTAEVTGVSLLSKSLPEPRPWVDDRKDGTYLVQFVCATPGQYAVTARVNGTSLPLCPVMIDVAPGRASAQHSDLLGRGVNSCTAGAQTDFTILARDEFGNECVRGGARFGVRAIGHARLHEVADNEDGTYSVSYSVPEWAQGPVRLEVMLDGVPLKGSPVVPRVHHLGRHGPEGDVDAKDREALSAGLLPAELKGLEWLRSHQPPQIPEVPFPGAAVDRLTSPGGTESAAAAARTAWRAADEWRALSDLRAEFMRCRDGLLRHQQLLLRVGDAVQSEVGMLKEKERSVDTLREDLTQVEDRLAWQRRYLSGEYARRVKQEQSSDARPGLEPAFLPLSRKLDWGEQSSRPLSPAASGFSPAGLAPVGLDESSEKVRQLQQEVEKKRQWLQALLEEEDAESKSRVRTRSAAVGSSWPQEVSSLPGGPLPGDPALTASGEVDIFGLLDRDKDGVITREEWSRAEFQAGRNASNFAGEYPRLPHLDPPRAITGSFSEDAAAETVALRQESHALTDKLRRRIIDPEVERSTLPGSLARGALGNQASLAQRFTVPAPPAPPPVAPPLEEDTLSSRYRSQMEQLPTRAVSGPLTAPPPPLPPPLVPDLPGGGPQMGVGSMYHGQQASPLAAVNANSQVIGASMRRLFQAYATSGHDGLGLARGGSGLQALLQLHDFSRLVSAAQLSLPSSQIEGAFQATLRQFGVGFQPLDGAPAVPFELFVELLVNLARRAYPDLGDSEAVAALFEEYLLPLERRLRSLEGLSDMTVHR